MIEFQDVCYAYDRIPVLRHVSFQIRRGDTVLLEGPNGAGKSTILKLLNGLIYPEQGKFLFEGTEITEKLMREHKYSKWYHQKVGFIWQNPDVQLFCGRVEEELAFGPQQMGLSAQEITRRVEDALQLLYLALGLDDEQLHGQNTKAWAASSSSPAGGLPKTIEGSVVVEPPAGVLGAVLDLALAPG